MKITLKILIEHSYAQHTKNKENTKTKALQQTQPDQTAHHGIDNLYTDMNEGWYVL